MPPALSTITDDQLLAKLADISESTSDSVAARRKRFMESRKRDDWRVRTQPVTQDEVLEADE